tara:strand:- start:520 stop:2529 length:2010 start_codon:yes stop_codon:yes gene_type:complete
MALTYGPLNKNIHTQSLELIGKIMLHCGSLFTTAIENINAELSYTVSFNNQTINVSELIRNANLNHIAHNPVDGELYFERKLPHINTSDIDTSYQNDPKYSSLSHGEQLAIKDFTYGSDEVNQFLYGDFMGMSGANTEMFDMAFLTTLMVASGLNKILPDIEQPTVYRGESYTSNNTIASYVNVIGNDSDFTQEFGFKSTSINEFVASSFATNLYIIIDNHNAKDIIGLSQHPLEEEYVINVEKFQWTSYEILEDDYNLIMTLVNPDTNESMQFENSLSVGTHILNANVINPLIEKTDEYNDNQLTQFIELYELALVNSLDIDFISNYNKKIIDSYSKQSHLDLIEADDTSESKDINDYTPHELILNGYPTNYVFTAEQDGQEDSWFIALRHNEYSAQVDVAVGSIFQYYMPNSPDSHVVIDKQNNDFYTASRQVENAIDASYFSYPENSSFHNYGKISVLAYFVGETDFHSGNYILQELYPNHFEAIKIDSAESFDFCGIKNPIYIDDILDNHWDFPDIVTQSDSYQTEQIEMIHQIAQTPFDVFESIIKTHVTSSAAEGSIHFLNKLIDESTLFDGAPDSKEQVIQSIDTVAHAIDAGPTALQELGFLKTDQLIEVMAQRHETFQDISSQLQTSYFDVATSCNSNIPMQIPSLSFDIIPHQDMCILV